ncbi:MAG TPA: D-aminoacyl-tRNA deacylase [Gammaproteobacteria bacterium]
MIALIQRVTSANVRVNGEEIARIDNGLLAFIGVEKNDNEKQAKRLVERIVAYRVFEDADGKMNLGLKDVGGQLLLVSQFTLAADTKKGMRPSFSSAAPPEEGRKWFDYVVGLCRQEIDVVATGQFGANMQVGLINDGPVTFWLES